METQRNGNNLSSLGEDDLDVRNSGHSADKTTNNRVLPFSIEAILSAPHPKKHSSVTRKMPRWSSQGTSTESPPAILTLEDFTSSNLPNDRSEEPETAEIGSRNLQQKLMAFQARLNARKRRKARTCFTNQQIFELERRFVYKKYLSPSDRDEIAHSLGISGAQVITWFQNRRAKFRRDLEELKSDVQAAKIMDNKQVNRLCKRLEI
ncbi:transcription factor LBX1-like [Stylophora pistillata]|uniref:Transcription factor LBX1 n=1 Tax=Stylophora pistillata TaxID=50429 RepID=A0A2B4SN51_STYPI|nr:transcription factor LBX1-like [Stylophora pistillata]PFX30300.1 Transcription factor LBX1 [Stylophora pistillata]